MTRRLFCVRPYDDRGTSLVLALVFITIGSLAVITVLMLADTSMKSTISLRSKVSETAAAEGAAQAAVNAFAKQYVQRQLRCAASAEATRCRCPTSTSAPNGTQDSARITCARDNTKGYGPLPALPRRGSGHRFLTGRARASA